MDGHPLERHFTLLIALTYTFFNLLDALKKYIPNQEMNFINQKHLPYFPHQNENKTVLFWYEVKVNDITMF